MDFEQTCCYIRHRLANVGGKLKIFSKEALKQLFNAYGGIPRLINLFCDGALIYGYGDEVKNHHGQFDQKSWNVTTALQEKNIRTTHIIFPETWKNDSQSRRLAE